MMQELDTELLAEIDLFQNMPASELEALIADSELVTIEKDQMLFQEGDVEHVFYVVLTGRIVVFKENKNVALRGPGEYFGEIALIDSSPRSANAKGMVKSSLLKIGGESFENLIKANSDFSLKLLKTLAARTREDIGALNRGYKKLKEQKKVTSTLNRILDDSSNEIYLFDPAKLNVSRMNKRAQENLGYEVYDIPDLTALDILTDLTRDQLIRLIQPLIEMKQSMAVFEGFQKRKNGETYPVDVRFQLAETEKGTLIVALVQDISERVAMENKIRRLAYFDDLTGLPNRNSLLDGIQSWIENPGEEKKQFTLLHIDLDRFKAINDSLGVEGGDHLLYEVVDRLKNRFSSPAELFRMRGDEFALLIPGNDLQVDATASAQQVMETLGPLFQVFGYDIHVTCSIGIAQFPENGTDPTTLLKNSDKALTEAKTTGKNRFCFYNTTLESKALHKLTLVSSLKKGLEKDEFTVYYQPKVDVRTKLITGAEALVRWNHADKGLVQPGQFIPVAEESLLIIPMGKWVLREACRQLKKWQDQGYGELALSVNFSGHQFHQKNAVELVAEAIQNSGCPAGNLELEFTESVLMENTHLSLQKIKDLKALGIRLSIDDFGTGFSSLRYLKDMPIDTLKIDRCFLQDIETQGNQVMVRSIVNLAQMLNLTTVAEGVETVVQEQLVASIGCDYIQGFLYSKPVPRIQFETLLANQRPSSTQ